MPEIRALVRASWLTAASYRLAMATSILGLAVVIVPLYFVASALQSTLRSTISTEADQYFAFVVIGAVVFSLVNTCATSLPSALDGAIGRGTLEAMMGTPAPLSKLYAGLMGYGVLFGVVRAAIVLMAGVLMGARLHWAGIPMSLGILALLMLAYIGIGLMLSACIVAFRTTGPLTTIVLTGSMFLGGVYYPARVIPAVIRHTSDVFPLTYGLRAIRQLLLRGDTIAAVSRDLSILGAMTLIAVSLGIAAVTLAMNSARKTGALASY